MQKPILSRPAVLKVASSENAKRILALKSNTRVFLLVFLDGQCGDFDEKMLSMASPFRQKPRASPAIVSFACLGLVQHLFTSARRYNWEKIPKKFQCGTVTSASNATYRGSLDPSARRTAVIQVPDGIKMVFSYYLDSDSTLTILGSQLQNLHNSASVPVKQTR